MKLKLNESVQMIHIGPNDKLTHNTISYALQQARSNYMYAKFYTDKYYVQVNFMRDQTINVSTNIRQIAFLNDYYRYERIGWTIYTVENFLYYWLQETRASLY